MNPDFLDIIRALSDAEVRFIIVGAYAVNLYVDPRATGDLDIWVEATPENATRLTKRQADGIQRTMRSRRRGVDADEERREAVASRYSGKDYANRMLRTY